MEQATRPGRLLLEGEEVTTTKKTQRIPRYKDKDGMYVDIFDDYDGIYLAWTNGEDEGARLGEESGNDYEVKATRDALHELMNTKTGYVYRGRTGVFLFEDERTAVEAKRLVNAALWNMQNNKPLPDWARKAVAEGWSPPKGWKP